MPTAPTAITPLPTAPSRADPANFPTRADAFLAALPTFGSQLNANASAAYTNASDSVTAANNAAASETNAAASAIAAAASALTALNAPGTSGTSTTSLTIGTGSQTFTTQGSKAWVVGQFVTVASTASPTNFMHGQITAYNSGTGSMTVNVLAVGGSGTLASWTIGLVGPNATLTDQNSLQPVALTLPSIRPSLLLDFANAKRLDPRVTFTRATSATYYDGVTSAKAEENLLLRSQDFSTTWTLANLTAGSAVTAPDATATGSSFTASAANGTLTQSVTAIAADYTFSVWLRRVSGTGDIDITAHSGGTWVTQSITSSWARYTVTQTLTAGTRTPGIRIVTSGDQIEVWGAQLEQRSAATAYTPTTTQAITNYIPQLLTAPAGVPRFDHNPTTGESLGLLVEEQRTNLVTYSEEFENWQNLNTTDIPNSAVAPNGSLTADLLYPSSSGTLRAIRIASSQSAGIYTSSIYAKSAGIQFLVFGDLNSNNMNAVWFDLVNGTVGTQASGYTGSITPVGNGWYRCVVVNPSITPSFFYFGVSDANGSTSVTASGIKGIFIWGAQLEAGAFPTSYIPTTSASVTRTADDARMTGANFSSWYNSIEGSVQVTSDNSYIRLSVNTWPSNINTVRGMGVLFGTTFSAAGPIWGPRWNSISNGFINVSGWTYNGGGTDETAEITNTIPLQVINTVAQAVSASGVSVSALGLVGSKADDPVRTGLNARFLSTAMLIGPAPYGAPFSGTVKRIAYYPARLTNAQLQALTA